MIAKIRLAQLANASIRSDHPLFSETLGSDEKGQTKKIYIGRHVYGVAAVFFGVLTFVWHDFNIWQQIRPLGNLPQRELLAYGAAIIEIFGGIAIQRAKTARLGALALGAITLTFALLWLPLIAAKPLVFDPWGNFVEQFSQFAGALIVYASFDQRNPRRAARMTQFGYISFCACVVSFTLEQLLYLSGTAGLVPKWIPPGQMFWAITTTVAFGLAAIALLTGRCALLASRLLTAMIMGFSLLIWLPAPFTRTFSDPHINWAGNAENLAIAGAVWIIADFVSQRENVLREKSDSQ